MFFLWNNRVASLSLYWVAARATHFLYSGRFCNKDKLTSWERRAVIASCFPLCRLPWAPSCLDPPHGILLFQAILLAHGGLATLGANTFSMAIAGPIVCYGIYRLCKKPKVNRLVAVGLAPPGGETESLLLCLQTALGAIVIGYGFGYLAARKKYRPKEAS